ncbi:MAG: ankyrin repeat domain-containing protein [Hoeflea sp.]|uniref:ankyrin repeat domain-containing protein n=1 Tax=Hoeflea sp. TaxID=1940281 RepID=UPI0032EDBAC8
MTTPNLDKLRKQAKHLRKMFLSGDAEAKRRVEAVLPDGELPGHSAALHVIAREQGHESWPKLKLDFELPSIDSGQRVARLRNAIFNGQHWIADRILTETPDLANSDFGLQCALCDLDVVRRQLAGDPALAVTAVDGRRPLLHLTFSRRFETLPGGRELSIAVAQELVNAGADVNDVHAGVNDDEHPLSALYGALGHARNLALAEWLLENGANPDDNESLYHATEMESLEGLKLLMRYGVTTAGTNALPRMLDFNNAAGVRLLLEYGADPNEGIAPHPSGEPSFVIPALHQAARRHCSGEIVRLLLAHGADGKSRYNGHSAYALARIYGNGDAAQELARAGQATELSANEELMAQAAEGGVSGALDVSALSQESRRILCRLLALPGETRIDHMKCLVAAGIDPDWTEEMGLPPVQIAAWEGCSDALAWLLTLSPDLAHRNRYGGDILETVLHGSMFSPNRNARDHIGCARLILEAGVAVPRALIGSAGSEDVADFIESWTQAHPDSIAD